MALLDAQSLFKMTGPVIDRYTKPNWGVDQTMQYFVWEKIMAKNIGKLVVSECGMTVIHDIVRVNCGYFVSRKKRKSVRCGYYVNLADNNWPDLLSWGWCYNPKILPVMYFFANHSKTFQICITLSPIWHYFANLLQLSPESIRAFVMFVISRLLKFISINSNATRASTHWAQCSIQSLLPAITHSPFFLQDVSPFITIL